MKQLLLSLCLAGLLSPAWAQSAADRQQDVLDEMAADQEFRNVAYEPPVLVATYYPNPASSSLNIVLAEPAEQPVDVSIYNYNGTMLRHFRYVPGGSILGLDVSSLPVGQYLVYVREAGKAVQSLKLVRNE